MPELPEVETVRRGLISRSLGKTIEKITLYRPDLRWPITEGIDKQCRGKVIHDIRRRAKYLLFDIGENIRILAHLGMSGSFRFEAKGFNRRTHDHVVLQLHDGTLIVYHDPRRFGAMLMFDANEEATHPLLANLAPEPLSDNFSADYLAQALAKKQMPIKPALMDQQLVVGVGNIYASESLFRAGIHPDTPACKVVKKAEILVESIKVVLNDAIVSGGSTLRDYLQVEGTTGYFQHRFNVYNRKGLPCFSCGSPISQHVQAGRATYHCPQCQPQRVMRKKH